MAHTHLFELRDVRALRLLRGQLACGVRVLGGAALRGAHLGGRVQFGGALLHDGQLVLQRARDLCVLETQRAAGGQAGADAERQRDRETERQRQMQRDRETERQR